MFVRPPAAGWVALPGWIPGSSAGDGRADLSLNVDAHSGADRYLDPDLSNNTAPVVMQVDIDVDVSELDPEVPAAFHPHQNYLNPFDPDATIPFAVKEPVHVVPTVYDVLGERVAMLVDAAYTPGHYELRFDARDQAYDAYLCRPEMGNFQAIWTTATVE